MDAAEIRRIGKKTLRNTGPTPPPSFCDIGWLSLTYLNKNLFSGEDKTHAPKKDFKQKDIISAISRPFLGPELHYLWNQIHLWPPQPLTTERPVKAWPVVGTLNLFGGTQTRGNLLGHLLFSSPEILNLEMPGVLKGLSCGFHILPALLWALLRVLTDWGGQVNSGRTRMTLFL